MTHQHRHGAPSLLSSSGTRRNAAWPLQARTMGGRSPKLIAPGPLKA
jgi:hypothetical protein